MLRLVRIFKVFGFILVVVLYIYQAHHRFTILLIVTVVMTIRSFYFSWFRHFSRDLDDFEGVFAYIV